MQEHLTWGSFIETLSLGEQFTEFTYLLNRMVLIGLIHDEDVITTQELEKLIEDEKNAAETSAKEMAAETRVAFTLAPLEHQSEDATYELPPDKNLRLASFLSVIFVYMKDFGVEAEPSQIQNNMVLKSSEMSVLKNALYHTFISSL